jgi:methyl-galactoside transport system substrate-binding protein
VEGVYNKMIRKISRIISLAVIIIVFSRSYAYKAGVRSLQKFNEDEKPIKVAVLFYTDIDYMNSMRESLEKVQQENLGKVQYDFYNAEDNQDLQNKQLDEILQKKDVDLILVNLVNQSEAKYIIDRIKEKNIPVIFFGGTDIKTIKSYNKAHWIGINPTGGGILQGEIIVELWNKNKDKIDKNRDNVLQYIMLKGPSDDLYVIERARNSILTANNAGIKTQELASVVSYWREEEAKNETRRLLSRFGNNIEMILLVMIPWL